MRRYRLTATVAQKVAGLRRMIVWQDKLRQAVEHVNAQSGTLSQEHELTRSTLHRLHQSLPTELRSALNATEGALLNFVQQQQSAQRGQL
jgi:hypothetical protein